MKIMFNQQHLKKNIDKYYKKDMDYENYISNLPDQFISRFASAMYDVTVTGTNQEVNTELKTQGSNGYPEVSSESIARWVILDNLIPHSPTSSNKTNPFAPHYYTSYGPPKIKIETGGLVKLKREDQIISKLQEEQEYEREKFFRGIDDMKRDSEEYFLPY